MKLIFIIASLFLLIALPARSDDSSRALRGVERFLQINHTPAYRLTLLVPDEPAFGAGRSIALARTEREPATPWWDPADPWFDTLVVTDSCGGRSRGAPTDHAGTNGNSTPAIFPTRGFRQFDLRFIDLDRDGEFEAAFPTVPYGADHRRDFHLIERSSGVTHVDRLDGLGFDDWTIDHSAETGDWTILHRFMRSAAEPGKRSERWRITPLGPVRLTPPDPAVAPLIPVAADALRTADRKPWSRIAGREYCVRGAENYRGPDAFAVQFLFDWSPADVVFRVRVRDDRPDFRGRDGDGVVLTLAAYDRSLPPLRFRVVPRAGGKPPLLDDGGDTAAAPAGSRGARIEPAPWDGGWGFVLTLPAAALAKGGITPADPAVLFRLEATNVEGPGAERYAQVLSSNGKSGAGRAGLSVLRWGLTK